MAPQLKFRNHAVDYIVANKRAAIHYTDADRIAFKRFLARGWHDQTTLEMLKVPGRDGPLRDVARTEMHPPVDIDALGAVQWLAVRDRIVNSLKYRLRDLVRRKVLVEYYDGEMARYTIRWTDEVVERWTAEGWVGEVDEVGSDDGGDGDGDEDDDDVVEVEVGVESGGPEVIAIRDEDDGEVPDTPMPDAGVVVDLVTVSHLLHLFPCKADVRANFFDSHSHQHRDRIRFLLNKIPQHLLYHPMCLWGQYFPTLHKPVQSHLHSLLRIRFNQLNCR